MFLSRFGLLVLGCYREGLFGSGEQGYQGLCQVQLHAQVHDVQLSRARAPDMAVETDKQSERCFTTITILNHHEVDTEYRVSTSLQ